MGYHDLSGYAQNLAGTLDDGLPSEEALAGSLAALAEEQKKYH